MIDSADVYSAWVPGNKGGESETVIGNWLKRDPAKRDKVVIATKVGFLSRGSRRTRSRPPAMRRSQRLGIETIDLYYHHKDDPTVPLAESLGAMDALVKAGKDPRDRPVAIFAPSGWTRRCDGGGQRPDPAVRAPDLVQYGRAAQAGGTAARHGLEARAGDRALLRPRQRLPDRQIPKQGRPREKPARPAQRRISRRPRACACSQALDRVAAETGAALATIALAWTNAQPGITSTLASATSVDQLRESLAAMQLQLTPEQITLLDEASA